MYQKRKQTRNEKMKKKFEKRYQEEEDGEEEEEDGENEQRGGLRIGIRGTRRRNKKGLSNKRYVCSCIS